MSKPDQPRAASRGWVIVAGVVVAVGLVAAIGWTWFRDIGGPEYWAGREAADHKLANSQDKAVIGNLRQIGAGADQYFLENGVSSVASATIVGTNRSQYVMSFQTVAQETYTPVIVQGRAISANGVAGARTITFGP